MTDLTHNLAMAWVEKFNRAELELSQARKYPAFFKQEYIDRAEAERAEAIKWYRYWEVQ